MTTARMARARKNRRRWRRGGCCQSIISGMTLNRLSGALPFAVSSRLNCTLPALEAVDYRRGYLRQTHGILILGSRHPKHQGPSSMYSEQFRNFRSSYRRAGEFEYVGTKPLA